MPPPEGPLPPHKLPDRLLNVDLEGRNVKAEGIAPVITAATIWPRDGPHHAGGVCIVCSDAVTIPIQHCRRWVLRLEKRLAKGCA